MIQRISNTVSKILNPSVWIVEDDNITAEILKRKISKSFKNVNVVIIRDGEEVLSKISNIESGICKCPKVAIIDRGLPSIPGEQVGVLMKKACPKIQTVLYSGDVDVSFSKAKKEAFGFTEILCKSSGTDALTNIISRFIQKPA